MGKDTNDTTKKKHKGLSWRVWHKWVGLFFSIFIILFCFSGIVMNHRQLLSGCEVSRGWLPEAYHIKDWNQGIIRGTMPLDSVMSAELGAPLLAWGQAGCWLTDSKFDKWSDFNAGITPGIDNRKITDVVQTADGRLWCSGLYDAYTYNNNTHAWEALILPGNDERISDIAMRGSDTVVVMTRSTLYEAVAPDYQFRERPVQTPDGYVNQTTLFKTFWMLHSGDLFGLPGRLVVDCMGLVLIVLCITGIFFFFLPYSLRRSNRQLRQATGEAAQTKAKASVARQARWMKWNLKWHNRFGSSLIVLTLLLSVTGMCLRPPFMIPLVLTHTRPVPCSTMDSDNAFHDKFRALRWDDRLGMWLLSTSEGFMTLGGDLQNAVPVVIPAEQAPQVSPMGITVFEKDTDDDASWLIGSMSGLYRWNLLSGSVTDWFTGEPYVKSSGYPVGGHAVTGYSADLAALPAVFDYSSAPNVALPPMPEVLRSQPMSLWNFALELHVGRCYEPFLGSVLSVLFVFISGLLLTLILISGYIIYRRSKPKQRKTTPK